MSNRSKPCSTASCRRARDTACSFESTCISVSYKPPCLSDTGEIIAYNLLVQLRGRGNSCSDNSCQGCYVATRLFGSLPDRYLVSEGELGISLVDSGKQHIQQLLKTFRTLEPVKYRLGRPPQRPLNVARKIVVDCSKLVPEFIDLR